MSAFTDWNGPGCGSGASLPQVKTLEQLILEVRAVASRLQALHTDLEAHENHAATGLHTPLREDYIANITNAKEELRGGNTQDVQSIKAALDAAKIYISNLVGQLQSGTVMSRLAAETNARIAADGAEETARLTLTADLNDLIARINTLEATYLVGFSTSSLKVDSIDAKTVNGEILVKAFLDCVALIQGELDAYNKIDFTKWSLVNAQVVPSPDSKYKPQVLLVGIISKDFHKQPNQPAEQQRFKPARAFVKFTNSMPWNAIVDMAAVYDSDNNTYNGTLNTLLTKTKVRKEVIIGLYRGTTKDGTTNIYLGLQMEEAYPTWTEANAGVYISGFEYYITGINFIPLNAENRSNGAVHEICTAAYLDDNENTFIGPDQQVFERGVVTDFYLDRAGHSVITIAEGKEDLDGVITIGDYEFIKQLNIFSLNRPNVVHEDGSQHQVAYLSDLSQSIYWQRDVKFIVDVLNNAVSGEIAANDLKIWKDQNDTIVGPPPDPDDPPAGWVQVPGIYYTDPAAPYPNGYEFVANDIALVKKSGVTKQDVVDGTINYEFGEAGQLENVLLNLISGIDLGRLTPGDYTSKTDAILVEDTKGRFGRLNAVNSGNVEDPNDDTGTFLVVDTLTDITTGPLPTVYAIPAYIKFDGTTWVLDREIVLPNTFDAHVYDVTYEWSGAHRAQVRPGVAMYFVEGYLTWTAHHDNATLYPEFNGNPWSYTDIPTAQFRSAARQDQIDHTLQVLASVQPDYSNNDTVIPYNLPESAPAMIPDPSFIHNKPWTGVAIVDGGFATPKVHLDWFIDGGDFTGMSGIGEHADYDLPAIPNQNYFRNVILKLWRGTYAQMPDRAKPTLGYKALYSNTLRWAKAPTGDGKVPELSYFEGETGPDAYYRILPIEAYREEHKYVLQYVTHTIDTMNNLVNFNYIGTNFTTENTPIDATVTIFWGSDLGPKLNADHIAAAKTIEFTIADDGTIVLTSPRIARLESEFIFKSNLPEGGLVVNTEFGHTDPELRQITVKDDITAYHDPDDPHAAETKSLAMTASIVWDKSIFGTADDVALWTYTYDLLTDPDVYPEYTLVEKFTINSPVVDILIKQLYGDGDTILGLKPRVKTLEDKVINIGPYIVDEDKTRLTTGIGYLFAAGGTDVVTYTLNTRAFSFVRAWVTGAEPNDLIKLEVKLVKEGLKTLIGIFYLGADFGRSSTLAIPATDATQIEITRTDTVSTDSVSVNFDISSYDVDGPAWTQAI